VVLSDQPENDVAQAIADLELFRAVVYKVTNAHEGNESIPVELLLFNDGDDFRATVKDPRILGYTRPELRKQYLVTSRGVIGMDTQHVIFHEYVHYLLRNGGTTALHPKWYDEGLAEMLAATRLQREGNTIVLGADIAGRIDDLRAGIYVPLSRVVGTNDLSDWHPYHVAIFYSKSFALVNYLHLSRMAGHDRTAQMSEYLRFYREGTDSSVAFEQAFGMSPAMMEKELGEFLSRPRRPVPATGEPAGGAETLSDRQAGSLRRA